MMVANKRSCTGLNIKKKLQKVKYLWNCLQEKGAGVGTDICTPRGTTATAPCHVVPHLFIVPYLMSSLYYHLGNKGIQCPQKKSRNYKNESVKGIDTLILRYHLFKRKIYNIRIQQVWKNWNYKKPSPIRFSIQGCAVNNIVKKCVAMCPVAFFSVPVLCTGCKF